jgi:hypothetical protein
MGPKNIVSFGQWGKHQFQSAAMIRATQTAAGLCLSARLHSPNSLGDPGRANKVAFIAIALLCERGKC